MDRSCGGTKAFTDLKNKVALVTGAGRGLGQAICEVLAESGVHVVLADIRFDLAEAAASALSRHGVRALAQSLDVRDHNRAEAVVGHTVKEMGRLDFLINNAALDYTVSAEELSVIQWREVIETNLSGPFLMSKLLFPVMRKQGGGHIVNVVSTASKRTWAKASAYHASKWGLLGFSHALHVEGRPHEIKVTAIVAGGMRTPFLLDRFPDIDVSTLQDPRNVAETIKFVLQQPRDTVIPEMMVIPVRETSWP